MSDLDVQQALSLRYRTSLEADSFTDQLRQSLALDTKAQVARLAIGRSLAMGKLLDVVVDSQGKDIPAMSLFSPENIGAWVGLLVSHSCRRRFKSEPPRRPNIEPGVEADFEIVGCG